MNTMRKESVSISNLIFPLIILTALLARIFAVFLVGDTKLEHEYEPIVLNMLAGRGFAYYSVDQSNELSTEFLANPQFVIPSAFRSPVYPLFLFVFAKVFGSEFLGMRVTEILQAIQF